MKPSRRRQPYRRITWKRRSPAPGRSCLRYRESGHQAAIDVLWPRGIQHFQKGPHVPLLLLSRARFSAARRFLSALTPPTTLGIPGLSSAHWNPELPYLSLLNKRPLEITPERP